MWGVVRFGTIYTILKMWIFFSYLMQSYSFFKRESYNVSSFKSLLLLKLPEVFYKKAVLKNFANSKESTCVGVSFLTKFQAWGWGEIN